MNGWLLRLRIYIEEGGGVKGRYNILTIIGVLIYVIYSSVDRFVVKIPDVVAIPMMIIGIILIIAGVVKSRNSNRSK